MIASNQGNCTRGDNGTNSIVLKEKVGLVVEWSRNGESCSGLDIFKHLESRRSGEPDFGNVGICFCLARHGGWLLKLRIHSFWKIHQSEGGRVGRFRCRADLALSAGQLDSSASQKRKPDGKGQRHNDAEDNQSKV